MTVAITGATGFIGRALARALLERGDHVIALSRDPGKARAALPGVEAAPWGGAGSVLPPCDAVVNLAGESISGRWTTDKKRAIRDSRVEGTRLLVEAVARCPEPPETLLNGSAVGYYGDRGEEALTEESGPGEGFLAEVGFAWEAEALKARDLGLRVALLRTAVVLGRGGGALPQMIRPFRMGLGGSLGSGRQWFPWIQLDDEVGLILHVLDNGIEGPVNLAAPGLTRNSDFTKALGRALGRPTVLPVPSFALKAVLGQFAETLLASQKVIPEVAQRTGYGFRYPGLELALRASL
jgi:uncharacterized protein (TIGR01777 family)